MFWKKKKKTFSTLALGLEVKKCHDCTGPCRPCEVEGECATFHRWVESDKALLHINTFTRPEEQQYLVHRLRTDGIVPYGCSTEMVHETYALVEYMDGSVAKVAPEKVRFTDRKEE